MRQSLSLSRHATAKLLRISLRTLQNWETGKVRIPYAAYKLVRLFNSYEIFHPIWHDWRIVGSKLITPEGHSLEAGDFHWLSLMARKAEAFSKTHRQLRLLQAQARPHTVAAEPVAPGLVYNSTSRKENDKNQQNKGFSGVSLERHPEPPQILLPEQAPDTPIPDGLPVRLQSAFLARQVSAAGGAL